MHTRTVELTPEVKEKLIKLGDEIIDLLKKRTNNPFEAFVCMHFIRESLEDVVGGPVEPIVISNEEAKSWDS